MEDEDKKDGMEPEKKDGMKPDKKDGVEPDKKDGVEPDKKDGMEPDENLLSKPPIPQKILNKQNQFLSTLSKTISNLSEEKDFPYDVYNYTKFIRKYGLDLSDTVGNDPWDSLVSCFLQNAGEDFVLDGVDDLLPLDEIASAQLEIQIQKCKRLAGNPSYEILIDALSGRNGIVEEQLSHLLEYIGNTVGIKIDALLYETTKEFQKKIDSIEATTTTTIISPPPTSTTEDSETTENDPQTGTPITTSSPLVATDAADDKTKNNELVPDKPVLYSIIWYDAVAKSFHNIVLRELMFDTLEDYCDTLLADIVENEELLSYHMRCMENIEILQITQYIEQQFATLHKIETISELTEKLMPNAQPNETVTLNILKGYESQLNFDNVSESLLYRSKQQYMFSLKSASDRILQKREADHRDKVRALVSQEEDMIKENDRLQEEEKAAEAEKLRKENEIKELERQISQKEGNKADLEKLIIKKKAELAKNAENLEMTLGKIDFNKYKKNLLNLEPTYARIGSGGFAEFQKCTTLRNLIERINSHYGNIPRVENTNAFWKYVNANDTQANKTELLNIIKNVLMEEPRISPNGNDSSILEITGRQIVLSKVLNSVQNRQFREIRIVAGKIIYVDCNLEQTVWHGKNVVLGSPEIEVVGTHTINVSGYSAKEKFPSHAKSNPSADSGQRFGFFNFFPNLSGRNGLDGQDGDPGESSGHVTVKADKIRNGGGLTIYANGGNGAAGQTGEDGQPGRDGHNGSNPTYGQPAKGTDYYKNGKRAEYGSAGTPGESGGNGGRAGLGGGGGHKGDILIVATASHHGIKTESKIGITGKDGEPGKGAKGGTGGINGVDELWIWEGWDTRGDWKGFRGKIQHVRRKKSCGHKVFWANFGTVGGLGDLWEWDYYVAPVGGSRASQGQNGNRGQTASQRSNQRKTATAKQAINQNAVSSLIQSVRNMYGTTASVEQAINQSQNEKSQLEQQQSNLNKEKQNATANVKRLEQEIKSATESKVAAQKAKAELEELIRINLQNQRQVESNLKRLASEISEAQKSTIVETTNTVGQQIQQIFQQQKQQTREEMQKRTTQQQQTSIIRDFQPGSELPSEKEDEYKTSHLIEIQSLYDEVRLVKNIDRLSDEFFTIALAARAKDPKQAEAFELGLQEIKSFANENKLPLEVRNYLESRSSLLQTDSTKSNKSPTQSISVEYLRDQLPQDVKITLKTQPWLNSNVEIRSKIFSTIEYAGQSLGEFLFLLRQHDAVSFKKKIATVETEMETLKQQLPKQSRGHILLDHVSKIVFQHLEDWFVGECKLRFKDIINPKLDEEIRLFANFVDDLFVEIRKVQPNVSLIETYDFCLKEITNPEFQQGSPPELLWERAALVLTGLASSTKIDKVTCIMKHFQIISSLLRGSKNAKTAIKIQKLNLLPKLVFITDYLVLNCDQIDKLREACSDLVAAASTTHLKTVYDQLAYLDRRLYSRYFQVIQNPLVSNIMQIVDETADNKEGKEIKLEIQNVVTNVLELTICPLKLQDRVDIYNDLLDSIKDSNNVKMDVKTKIKEIKSNCAKFRITTQPEIDIEIIDLIQAIETPDKPFIMKFQEALATLTRKIEQGRSRPNSEIGKMSSTFISKLAAWLKTCGVRLQQVHGVTFTDLVSLNFSVANFCMKNIQLTSTEYFLIRDIFQDLNNILANIWTLSVFKKLQSVPESISKEIQSWLEKKTEIVKFVKDYVINSDEVVGATDFLSSVEMHICKILIALQQQGDASKVTEVLQNLQVSFKQATESGGTTPAEFLNNVCYIMNETCKNVVNLNMNTQEIQSQSLLSAINNFNTDAWNFQTFVNLIKSCCTTLCSETVSVKDVTEVEIILHHLTHAFAVMQIMNHKNYQPNDENKEHEALCNYFAEIFEVIANTEEKCAEKLSEAVAEYLQTLKLLIQSAAEKDITVLQRYLEQQQESYKMSRDYCFTTVQNQILSVLGELLEIYFNSSNFVMSFAAVMDQFSISLENQIIPKLLKYSSYISPDEQKQIVLNIETMYFESLLKYFNLQSVPTMPTELRATVFHLRSSKVRNQLTIAATTLLRLITNKSPDDTLQWLLPFLFVLNKLIVFIPEGHLSCREIQIVNNSFNEIIGKINETSILSEDTGRKCKAVVFSIQSNLVAASKQILKAKFMNQCSNSCSISKQVEMEENLDEIINQAEQVLTAISQTQQQWIDFLCKFFSTIEVNEEQISAGNLSITVRLSGLNWNIQTPIPVLVQLQILKSTLKELAQSGLRDRFGTDFPDVELYDTIEKLSTPLVKNWDAVFGLVVLSCSLNDNEKLFFRRVLRGSNKSAMNWEPSGEQEQEVLALIKRRYETSPPDESNEFLKAIMKDVDFQDSLIKQILQPQEQSNIDQLFSFTAKMEQEVVTENLRKLLTLHSVPEWVTELSNAAVTKVFTKFVSMYSHDFNEALVKAKNIISVESYASIEKESQEFLTSHIENLRNRDAFQLQSDSLVETIDNKDHQDKNVILGTLKYFIEQLIILKYNFSRSLFFSKDGYNNSDVDNDLWFNWMHLLQQRCILRKLPIQELNKLLQRSADLPVSTLIKIASRTSLQNWMEALYFQIVIENYKTFSGAKHTKKSDDFNLIEEIHEIQNMLNAIKATEVTKRFLLILGDKILLEAQLSEIGSTNVTPETIKTVLTQIGLVVINHALLDKLEKQGIAQWTYYIREQSLLFKWPPNVTALILKLESQVGIEMSSDFLDLFNSQFSNSNKELIDFLTKITSNKWILDEEMVKKIKEQNTDTSTISIWEDWFEAHAKEVSKRFRDSAEITRLMRDDNTNFGISNLLKPDDTHVDKLSLIQLQVQQVNEQLGKISTMGTTSTAPISSWEAKDIMEWAAVTISLPENERRTKVENNKTEVIAVLCQGLRVFTTKYDSAGAVTSPGFLPRDTQLMSVLLLIDAFYSRKGRLAEISTGEGKTFIVAMMATFRALAGDDVDVITASPVLAEDNAKEVTGYFAMFGISVSNNCDKECEQEEEKRKPRYKCQVIYGDVGSFQRDILLTSFFGKGITMNRTTETVVIDEVDSMLLDKGENILYLSHSIPDLKYLWPLLVEIWQAVHAPDVSRGRLQDINMVVCFIRERIRSGDIFFPNRLTSFIQRRLTIWVKNAFLAESMPEDDPYILADVDKKGAKVIIVDKDTGVEQVQMHWSNGLHQFLQLKHGDKLSSESLKAVFMSNIGYFQQFRGRLYGITGTLGSTAERDLLAQCYDVDFFSMPRFKARKCYEHEGIISEDERSWLESMKNEVRKKTNNDSRAVLIICESVASVDKIAKALKAIVPPSKIYSYKSSFDEEFHKRNRNKPLTSGDVIVATNLAGRGTDLKTSKELEGFGGLHVILSYMTTNVRVEVQAFGRTARAGLSGTVQFVILKPISATVNNNNDTSIEQLRQVRDLKESERLDNFRTKNMQRIEIEEDLCIRFNSLYEKVKGFLEQQGVDGEYKELQLEFMKNHWALWLESMSEKIKVLHVIGRNSIFESFNSFERDMLSKAHSSSYNRYATGAIEMTKLGRHFEIKEKYSDAEHCFNTAIQMEPNYAEISHYYKAACIIKQTDSGVSSKRQAIYHLKQSSDIIKKRIGQMMTASKTLETTDGLRREGGKGTASNRFEKQVKSESELYQVHVGKIEEAIGHAVDGEFLSSKAGIKGVINKAEGDEIFKALRRQYNIIKNFRMSQKVNFSSNDKIFVRNKRGENTEVEWPTTFNYCKREVIAYLRSLQGQSGATRVIEPEGFSRLVQSQTTFWVLLRQNGFLQNESSEIISVIKADKEATDRLSLPQGNLSDCHSALQKILLSKNDQVFTDKILEPLGLQGNDLKQLSDILRNNGLLEQRMNGKAQLSQGIKNSLKWNATKKQWDGLPSSLLAFKDIIEAFIEEDLKTPENEDEIPTTPTQPSLKDVLSMSDLPLPIYNDIASRQLWDTLNEFGAIKDCKVNFSVHNADTESAITSRLDDIEKALKNNSELKSVFKQYHKAGEAPEIDDVMEVLKSTIGKLKTLPAIEVSYEDLEEYFKTGEYPPEIQEFRDMIFMDLLECTEKKSWWDWGAFIVAMLGIAQIIAGVLLEVFTAGAATYIASALISEGIGDIGFAIEAGINKNFSWKSYRDHKIMSLMITIVSAGVGAWLSRGAQVAKFAGKAGFQLFKAVTIRVLKKSLEAVIFKLADIGIDKLLEHIQAEAIKNCSSELRSLFTSDPAIKSKLAQINNKMDILFQYSYEQGQAKKIIEDGLQIVLKDMQKEGLGVKLMETASKVTSGIAGAMGKASGKLTKHGNRLADQMKFGGGSNALGKAAKLAEVATVIEKLIKGGEIMKQLLELVNLAPDVLNRLISYLEIQTINLKNSGKGTNKTDAERQDFATFKSDFVESTKNELIEMLLSKINSGLVSPAFQDLTHSALQKAGKAAQENTKALMHYLRTPKSEEIKILRTLRRKDALNEGKIADKLKGKIDLDELDVDTPIKNSEGKTIGELRRAYGDAISVYKDQTGKYYVERPSFEQSIKALGQGRKAGFYELMICANYYKQSVEISDFSGELESDSADGKIKIHPHGKDASNKGIPPLRVAYVKGENGFGYFAPMVDGDIVPLARDNKDTVNNNLYQALGFLNKAKAKGISAGTDEWDSLVEEFNNPTNANKSLGSISKYALNSKSARFLYDAGAYEVGNKLWDRSGNTSARVLTKNAKTLQATESVFDDGKASKDNDGDGESKEKINQGWKGNSVEILKVGDDFTVIDSFKPSRSGSFELSLEVKEAIDTYVENNDWTFRPTMPIIRQTSELDIDFDLLNKGFNTQPSRSITNHPSFNHDLENLQGYPLTLIRARSQRDSGQVKSFKSMGSNSLHLMEFKVHPSNSLHLMEFPVY